MARLRNEQLRSVPIGTGATGTLVESDFDRIVDPMSTVGDPWRDLGLTQPQCRKTR